MVFAPSVEAILFSEMANMEASGDAPIIQSVNSQRTNLVTLYVTKGLLLELYS